MEFMRRLTRTGLCPLIVASLILAAYVTASGQQPSVTFRAETNFVEVHAIVTDQAGAFVRNLTKDDFKILEDGKPRTPSAFSLINLPIERPFTPPGAPEPIESDVHATTRTF